MGRCLEETGWIRRGRDGTDPAATPLCCFTRQKRDTVSQRTCRTACSSWTRNGPINFKPRIR